MGAGRRTRRPGPRAWPRWTRSTASPSTPTTIAGPYVDFTVDHLFGTIWTRPALDIRDRRLLTIGVLAALGQSPLLEIQFRSALERGELTEEQVREIVLHLTHYIGWPLSTGVNAAAEKVIGRAPGPGRGREAPTRCRAATDPGTRWSRSTSRTRWPS